MEHRRYDRQKDDPEGFWMIIDVFTGQPATLDGILMAGLDLNEANDFRDILNCRDIKSRKERGIA
jgi:hypothetical protein